MLYLDFSEVYLQTHVKILHIKTHRNFGNHFLAQHRQVSVRSRSSLHFLINPANTKTDVAQTPRRDYTTTRCTRTQTEGADTHTDGTFLPELADGLRNVYSCTVKVIISDRSSKMSLNVKLYGEICC